MRYAMACSIIRVGMWRRIGGIQRTTGQAVKGYAELLQYHEAAAALDSLVDELIAPNLAFNTD